ncbi:hypothetical protein G6F27_013746 [Rhizopus arrhizus]|nr:hypothetical protein G6F27_013746 [Rhizopus arrhizus]
MSDNAYFGTASQAVSQLLWTFSNDLCNELLEHNVDKDLLNNATEKVLQKYIDTGLKLKPAVTARSKRTKAVTSPNTVMNIIKSKKNINIHTANWHEHPDDPTLSYTHDIIFHTKRHPVIRDNKLVLTADENGTYEPTNSEIGEAQLYGLVA